MHAIQSADRVQARSYGGQVRALPEGKAVRLHGYGSGDCGRGVARRRTASPSTSRLAKDDRVEDNAATQRLHALALISISPTSRGRSRYGPDTRCDPAAGAPALAPFSSRALLPPSAFSISPSALRAAARHVAVSTKRCSRMTITLIVLGYWSSSSMRWRMSEAISRASLSPTRLGATTTRTSRPA